MNLLPVRGDDFVRGIQQLRKEMRSDFNGKKRALQEVVQWRLQNCDILPRPATIGEINTWGTRYWEKECGFKLAHFTLESALHCIEELKAKGPHDHDSHGAPLTVYVCRWCDWFHVGHFSTRFPNSVVWVDGND